MPSALELFIHYVHIFLSICYADNRYENSIEHEHAHVYTPSKYGNYEHNAYYLPMRMAYGNLRPLTCIETAVLGSFNNFFLSVFKQKFNNNADIKLLT